MAVEQERHPIVTGGRKAAPDVQAQKAASAHLLAYLGARPGQLSVFCERAYVELGEALVEADPAVRLFVVDDIEVEVVRAELAAAEKFLCAVNRRYAEDGMSERVTIMIDAALERSQVAWTISDASDVWPELLAVPPGLISDLNMRILTALQGASLLTVENEAGTHLEIELDAKYEWVEIDGFVEAETDLTVNLPPGEVATYSPSVNGTVCFTGGLLGTIPIGRKYGFISEPFRLEIVDSQISEIWSGNASLLEDLRFCFGIGSYTDRVCEIGLGTNPAIRTMTGLNYTYEEKHYGFHLGFGASLAQQNVERLTDHHLDLIFADARVLFDGMVLFDGEYQV